MRCATSTASAGITVLCNLHSLDLARGYCSRLIGMRAGRVVFDGRPEELTDACRHRTLRPRSKRRAGRPEASARHPQDVGRCKAPPDTASQTRPPQTGATPCSRAASILQAAAGLAALSVSGTAALADWKAEYPELIIAVVPDENATGVEKRYEPFIQYLSKQLGVPVKLRIANDYAAVIEGQIAGNIHIAQYGPAAYARAYMNGAKIDAFAMQVNKDGTKGYYSVL